MIEKEPNAVFGAGNGVISWFLSCCGLSSVHALCGFHFNRREKRELLEKYTLVLLVVNGVAMLGIGLVCWVEEAVEFYLGPRMEGP